MKSQLYVMRHALSEGNSSNVIQGGREDYSLEESAIPELDTLLSQHSELKGINRVIHSPLKRAVMTARISGEFFGKPLYEDPLLVEVNAGVLSGMPKKEAALKRSRELEVWNARGDLDQIEGAERGDFVQARVIAFLERYLRETSTDLIVGHAAFNRCLLNTLYGRPRAASIDMSHNKIYVVDDTSLEIEELTKAKSSKAYLVKTPDKKYVLKISQNMPGADLSSKIMERLSNLGRHTPRTLNLCEKDIGVVRVLDYLEGSPFDASIGDTERKALLYSVYQHHQDLVSFGKLEGIEGLECKLKKMEIMNDEVRSLFKIAMDNAERFFRGNIILVNNDLNRDNILCNQGKIGIIDLDTFVYAPKDFQLASFATCFFGSHSPNSSDMEWAMKNWPKRINQKSFAYFSLCRALMGANFFDRVIKNGDNSAENIAFFNNYMSIATKMSKSI